tara:strand:+ start:454 stop:621 length:168 start_codon:yes stop_codon:yes gene_type:complete
MILKHELTLILKFLKEIEDLAGILNIALSLVNLLNTSTSALMYFLIIICALTESL